MLLLRNKQNEMLTGKQGVGPLEKTEHFDFENENSYRMI